MRVKTLSLWKSMMSRLHKIYADDVLGFGRYEGTKLRDVPLSYLKWFIVNGTDRFLAEVFALELGRRDKSFR